MIEKVNIAGGVILNLQNEIVLVYNAETGNWSYPKGHVKEGESLLQTALREVQEETSLQNLKYIRELPIYQRSTRQKKGKIKVMHLFLFQTRETQLRSNTSDTPRVEWVPLKEVPLRFLYKEDVEYFNQIKGTLHHPREPTP